MSGQKPQNLLEVRVVPNMELLEKEGIPGFEDFVVDTLDEILEEVDFNGIVINPNQFILFDEDKQDNYRGRVFLSTLKNWAFSNNRLITLDGNYGQDFFTNDILAASLESEGYDYVTLNPMNGMSPLQPFLEISNYGLVNITDESEVMQYCVRDNVRDKVSKLYMSLVSDLIDYSIDEKSDYLGIAFNGSLEALENIGTELSLLRNNKSSHGFFNGSVYLTIDLDEKSDTYAVDAIRMLSKLKDESWISGNDDHLGYDMGSTSFTSSLGMADDGITRGNIVENFRNLNNSINEALQKYQ